MSEEDEEEFTPEEMRMGVLIFMVLYFVAIFLLFVAIGVMIYLGATKYNWKIAIPLWAVLFFSLRVLKTYMRNLWLGSQEMAEEAYPSENLNIDSNEQSQPSDTSELLSAPSSDGVFKPGTILAVTIGMLLASAFWYGIGRLVSAVF